MLKEKRTTLMVLLLAAALALAMAILQWRGSGALTLRGTSVYAPMYQPMTMPDAAAGMRNASRTSLKELRDRRMRRAQKRKSASVIWDMLKRLSSLLANLLGSLLARLSQL